MHPTLTFVRELCLDLLALVLPVRCAGCGRYDRWVCQGCRHQLGELAKRVARDARPLPFNTLAGRLLIRLKHADQPGLSRVLAPVVRAATARASPDALWVPVPSRAERTRERGYRHLDLLLRAGGISRGRIVHALKAAPERRGQTGLSVAERRANAGRLRTRRSVSALARHSREGREVWVFDDTVTTGASLEAVTEALQRAGVSVSGAIALCRVPRKLARS